MCKIILINSPLHLVISNDTIEVYALISALNNLFASPTIMVRLMEVQRGRAMVLLMQGHRQNQVATQFDTNVFCFHHRAPCPSS